MHPSGIATASSDLRSQFLEGLAAADRKAILAAGTARRITANSVVTNQGNSADHLYLITKGRARHFFFTETGKKLLFHWLVPGDTFGGRCVLPHRSTYLFSTEMVTDSWVLVWDRSTIRDLVKRYPKLLENGLTTASDYLTWHLTSHIGLVCYTARQRVAQVLVTLAHTIGQKTPGGIELHITNEEVANAANVTPFTTSRLISEWRRNGALKKGRGKILLRSPERLFLHIV